MVWIPAVSLISYVTFGNYIISLSLSILNCKIDISHRDSMRIKWDKMCEAFNKTWQIIKVQWILGGGWGGRREQKNPKLHSSFILYSGQYRVEEFRLLQCSAIPWRYKDCKFSWYKARTRDTQIIIPGLILASILHILQFIRTKIGCFQACFLYNRIQERTYSLWAHLWKNRADYKNPLFRADHSQTQGTLHLPTTPCNFMYKYVNL